MSCGALLYVWEWIACEVWLGELGPERARCVIHRSHPLLMLLARGCILAKVRIATRVCRTLPGQYYIPVPTGSTIACQE